MKAIKLIDDTLSKEVYSIIFESGQYLYNNHGLVHWKDGYPLERIQDDIKNKEVYLFKCNDEYVGTVTISYTNAYFDDDAKALYFSKFAVLPSKMKCGYGKQILEYIKRIAKEANKKYLRCDCYEKSLESLLFYYHNGFYFSHKEKTKHFVIECLEYQIKKRVLVIGAGFLQAYVIKKSKELGYYTCAVDGSETAPGFQYADEYSVIDIVDKQACLAYAKEKQIDGVLTAATDYGVLTSSYIARELNLKGLDYNIAKIIKNKYLVQQLLYKNGVINSPCFELSSQNEIEEIKDQIKYPIIVKPCDGSGSRGISKVEFEQDLVSSVEQALSNSISKKCIIEPFISGKEYGAEFFVYEDNIYDLIVMKKKMTNEPYYAELGHSNCLDDIIKNKVLKKAHQIINVLGINFGSINMDFIVNNENIYMVDIGARMGGNLIGSHIIPYSNGIDYMKMMVEVSLGNKFDCNIKFNRPISTRIITLDTGIVQSIDMDKINSIDCLYKLILPKIGSQVHGYRNNLDGCGYIICTGENEFEAELNADNALNTIKEAINVERGE
ncbi:GNAT family N-acetyltransferase [[Clostridium] spiroforme]|nr:GNAT family N-acetyltransferase [Thomasclavelia spiroformis]